MNKIFVYLCTLVICLGSCLPDDYKIPDTNDDRDKIVASWLCAEKTATTEEIFYHVDIEKDSLNDKKVLLYNFYGLDENSFLKATMSGMKLTVANELIDGHLITGEGIIASNYNTINWSYEVTELKKIGNNINLSNKVTATYTR